MKDLFSEVIDICRHIIHNIIPGLILMIICSILYFLLFTPSYNNLTNKLPDLKKIIRFYPIFMPLIILSIIIIISYICGILSYGFVYFTSRFFGTKKIYFGQCKKYIDNLMQENDNYYSDLISKRLVSKNNEEGFGQEILKLIKNNYDNNKNIFSHSHSLKYYRFFLYISTAISYYSINHSSIRSWYQRYTIRFVEGLIDSIFLTYFIFITMLFNTQSSFIDSLKYSIFLLLIMMFIYLILDKWSFAYPIKWIGLKKNLPDFPFSLANIINFLLFWYYPIHYININKIENVNNIPYLFMFFIILLVLHMIHRFQTITFETFSTLFCVREEIENTNIKKKNGD